MHRELNVQVDCGDDTAAPMNGVANCDELKIVKGLSDNYRGLPHCHNEESDAGSSPLRTDTAVDQLDCQIR